MSQDRKGQESDIIQAWNYLYTQAQTFAKIQLL